MSKSPDEPPASAREPESVSAAEQEPMTAEFPAPVEQRVEVEQPAPEPAPAPAPAAEEWWTAAQPQAGWSEASPVATAGYDVDQTAPVELGAESQTSAAVEESNLPNESVTGGAYFCGDTSFFSLNWALQTIAKEKLTGTLRLFWHQEPVDLLAQEGRIGLVTTRDPEAYCSEAPITLVNVDADRIAAARTIQRDSGCPLFVTLAQENLILREPAMQLVQHYGQKLFAQLWMSKRTRFVFTQNPLPGYAGEIPGDADVDNWTLATLRFIQSQDLGNEGNYNGAAIPAYTKDGFERVQALRLTVAEAQFASQFNGVRSLLQIAKNLRLDLKFARVTLFRFLALEIVECWPPTATAKSERKGVLQRLTRTIGLGE